MKNVKTFELVAFPDLSLPRYQDLFGGEALAVASTRLFSWLQLVASADANYTFALRYLFTPAADTNRRLRIFVIIRSAVGGASSPIDVGRKMAQTIFQIDDAPRFGEEFAKRTKWHMATLERSRYAIDDNGDVLLYPALWSREAASRKAAEPYLDEAFDSLNAPAFIDIQLYAADASNVRQELSWLLNSLSAAAETRPNAEVSLQHYRAIGAAVAADPTAHLLICAGSPAKGAAAGLLAAFGVDTVGGGRFSITESSPGTESHASLLRAVDNAEFAFDKDGWYATDIPEKLRAAGVELKDGQREQLQMLSELNVLAGPDLIRDVLSLPIPQRGYLRTFPLETELRTQQVTVAPESHPDRIIIGRDTERDEVIGLPIRDLSRHAFVAGVTGSGKTMTMLNILVQLRQHEIPFIVFEPAKAEYRSLIHHIAGLRVFTPGRDDLSPIRLNPFEFEGHVKLAEHVASLVAAFSCAFALFRPLPTILEEALWELYLNKGWQEDDRGDLPTDTPHIASLLGEVERAIDNLRYDPEITSRFKGAFRSRLSPLARGSLARLFSGDRSLPSLEELCTGYAVVELRTLSQEQANLVIMFFMIALREYLRETEPSEKPRLVLVLEEAHNLVPAVVEQSSSEEGSARVEASRYISNMLAEMRALGLSIMVVDQSPAAVAAQVIRNTNLKIAHRTVARQDRETLADSMLMEPLQMELLGRLVPGQAYLYADTVYRPRLVRSALVAEAVRPALATGGRGASIPTDAELQGWLKEQAWYEALLNRRAEKLRNELGRLLDQLDEATSLFADAAGLVESHARANSTDQAARAAAQNTAQNVAAYCESLAASSTARQRNLSVEARALKGQSIANAEWESLSAALVGAGKAIDLLRETIAKSREGWLS